jgi:hypothetical protein
LQQHQDDADAGHEARNHRVGHHRDVTPKPEQTEQDLKDPGQNADAEGHRQGLLRAVGCGGETDDH